MPSRKLKSIFLQAINIDLDTFYGDYYWISIMKLASIIFHNLSSCGNLTWNEKIWNSVKNWNFLISWSTMKKLAFHEITEVLFDISINLLCNIVTGKKFYELQKIAQGLFVLHTSACFHSRVKNFLPARKLNTEEFNKFIIEN